MTTLEGFLSQAIGEPPRMTTGQKAIVSRGAQAALNAHLPAEAANALVSILIGALAGYPDSTACACCDMFRGGHCLEYKQEIPADWLPRGCDRFADDGTPF